MKTLFTNALLIFGLSALVTACGGDPPPQPAVVIPATTKVLDKTAQASLETIQPNTLTFAGAQTMKAGDVVVSAPSTTAPDGFLRKVTGVRSENGKTILETAPATLRDAIQKGSLKETRALLASDIESTNLTKGVTYSVKRDGLQPRLSDPTFSFNKVLFDQDGKDTTTDDQVVLSGLLDLSTTVRFDWDIDFFPPDFDFLAEAKFIETSNLKLKGKVSYDFVKKIRVGEVRFKAITFSIGPVPVVIRPIVQLDIGVRGSAGGAVDVSVTQQLIVTAGAKFNEEWTNLSDVSNTFTVDSSDISAAIKAEAFSDVTLQLLLYEAVGLFIRPEVFVAFDAQLPRKPFWKLDAGIGIDVGVAIDKWGIEKEYSTRVFEKRFPIAQSANSSPTLLFTNLPSTVDLNRSINLIASAKDLEDGFDVTTKWTSSLASDGTFDTGQNINKVFNSAGARTITATATDSDGASTSKSFVLNVVNSAPVLNVSEPSDASIIYKDLSYSFQANATDNNEPGEQLACSGIHWISSLAGDNFSQNGCVITASFSSTGTRTLTITGTDPQGLNQAKTVVINVLPTPANRPPRLVSIVSPSASFKLGVDGFVTVTANPAINDPEGGAVTLEWFVAKQNLDGTGTPTEAFEANIKLSPDALGKVNVLTPLGLEVNGCLNGFHINIRITLVASDPQGNPQPNSVVLPNIACVP
jgi:PKD domain